MSKTLYYQTVSHLLLSVLQKLMITKEFNDFRLVGGTALCLQLGHRESLDIDLFTDINYGAADFEAIDSFLRLNYPYVDPNNPIKKGLGKTYYVGENERDCIKLDLFYTEKFMAEFLMIDNLRIASIEEIIAMKVDVISRCGRKKDFWDIHELMDDYTFNQMLAFHEKRMPFHHDRLEIIRKFTAFNSADQDFDPICLRGKHWEVIKLDMIDYVNQTHSDPLIN
ncbi:MAG: nucleotidyl transferase AbiEii/AbiGii toxin family protein [Bacteroidetes bacterium]|nr:nucleotidyl transferase AbiEii/AbiGii toxin family protein [Bacteroidota bacterium]